MFMGMAKFGRRVAQAWLLIVALHGIPAAAALNESAWPLLKESIFAGREVIVSESLRIEGPKGAENAAQVPVTLWVDRTGFPADDKVQRIYLLVDANPIPLAATYHVADLPGEQIHLSTRIRIETDSHIRAIAETSDGKLFMASTVIHAGGGCAGAVDADDAAVRAGAGQIKTQFVPPAKKKDLGAVAFTIKHPMYTGLQKDKNTGNLMPAYYVKQAAFSYNGSKIMQADFNVGTAENPYLRFNFTPQVSSILNVRAQDNEDRSFEQKVEIIR